MFYVQLAALGGILGPLKSDLGVIWPFRAIFLSFQNRFSQNPSWTNLDLLESISIYIFVTENQKNYHGQFVFS